MDAQDFRSLQEAYLDVYEAVDDEGRAYRKPTGAGGRPIVRTELPDHMKSPKPRPVMTYAERKKKEAGKTPEQKEAERKKRMKLAQSLLRQPQKEQVDLYDIILSHLLDEGYAETPEAAEAIMVNMSEEWRQSIID